jgi:hypothetical protein
MTESKTEKDKEMGSKGRNWTALNCQNRDWERNITEDVFSASG